MPAQSANANTTADGVKTTSWYEDRGDGTDSWVIHHKTFDGGDVAQGATTDAAITNPATDGTLIAFTRGILTQLASIITRLTAGATTILKLEDTAHASGDAGVMALAVRRDTAAASSGTTGDYEPLQTDSTGRLRISDSFSTRIGALSNARTTSLAQTLLVKASAGTLFGIQGYVATDGFVQIHADADGTLAGGAQALEVIQVSDPTGDGNGGPFSLDFGVYGIAISTGITIAFSSSGPTFTGGGAQMFVSAQYA